MKRSSALQYLAGLVIAVLLFFLFSQSQLNQLRYEKTIISLLTLLEVDSRIKRQIIELSTGKQKNYGGLVSSKTQIESLLKQVKDPDNITNLSQQVNTAKQLNLLEKELSQKFAEIEIFKSKNAVLRNTLHYLPKFTENLISIITARDDISDIQKSRSQSLLNTVVSKIFAFNAQTNTDTDKLKQSLSRLKNTLQLDLPEPLHDEIHKAFKHAGLIISLHAGVTKITASIISSASSNITKSLYNEFNNNFLAEKRKADFYRFWLFLLSLALLLYLAFVFFKLQQATVNLKKSMIDLEFQKYALDEHSIVSITDVKGIIIYANERFCRISQYSTQELIGQYHRIVKSDLHDDAFFKDMWNTIANGGKWHGVIANRAKDGSIYWVDSTILPRMNGQNKPYQYIGIRTDITAQKEAEHRAEVLARFPSENPDPVLRLNKRGKLLYANPASLMLLKHWQVKVGSIIPDKWLVVCNRVLTQDTHEEHEIKISQTHYLVLFSPIKEENYVNLYARNITEIKQAEKKLNYQATHDSLTQLINRFEFESRLRDSLAAAQLENINSVLLYIDLDQFKVVNDTCGHIAGDELLRQISLIFTHSIRETDILARLGGDEFGVIFNKCDIEHGQFIGEKILQAINNFRFLWDNKSFEIGASIGLVEISAECDSIVTLLGKADIACYAAKDAGRNRIQVYQQDQAIEQRQDEMQWVTLIPTALAENRFILYGQLIKPLNSENEPQSHYEILIRYQNEKGDIIPPGAFIPAAERYGLMHSIDMWVITSAFGQLQEYNRNKPDNPVHVAINLSGQSMGNKHILDYIPDMIRRFDIDAKTITFEITETSAISNLTAAIAFITKLKSLGCQFALDDFGSGLSSFAYLKNLPVDFLKIDGAFIKDILDDPIDAAMVQSINQIGHVMNIKTIAEFVENKQIENRLSLIKVDFAQGYGIEKPRPFTEILQQSTEEYLAKKSLP